MNRKGSYGNSRNFSIFIIGITFIITFCLVSGCASQSAPVAQSVQKNLSQHLATDIVIPVDLPSDLVSSNVMTKKNGVPAGSMIYEGLVTKNRNGSWIPVLAKGWEVSDDGKTWTFHLVHDATWNDGVPLTSADVKFTYDYMKANNLTMGFVLSDVQSVTCPDDYTRGVYAEKFVLGLARPPRPVPRCRGVPKAYLPERDQSENLAG